MTVIDAAMAGGAEFRDPRRRDLTLVGLQPMADIAGLVGGALGVDHDRQIAADAERIHVIEEDRPLRIEHVLHIVLGGGQQYVEAGLLHQPIKLGGIEGDGAGSRFGLDAILMLRFLVCCDGAWAKPMTASGARQRSRPRGQDSAPPAFSAGCGFSNASARPLVSTPRKVKASPIASPQAARKRKAGVTASMVNSPTSGVRPLIWALARPQLTFLESLHCLASS